MSTLKLMPVPPSHLKQVLLLPLSYLPFMVTPLVLSFGTPCSFSSVTLNWGEIGRLSKPKRHRDKEDREKSTG